jgi:hypothetical protein
MLSAFPLCRYSRGSYHDHHNGSRRDRAPFHEFLLGPASREKHLQLRVEARIGQLPFRTNLAAIPKSSRVYASHSYFLALGGNTPFRRRYIAASA